MWKKEPMEHIYNCEEISDLSTHEKTEYDEVYTGDYSTQIKVYIYKCKNSLIQVWRQWVLQGYTSFTRSRHMSSNQCQLQATGHWHVQLEKEKKEESVKTKLVLNLSPQTSEALKQ